MHALTVQGSVKWRKKESSPSVRKNGETAYPTPLGMRVPRRADACPCGGGCPRCRGVIQAKLAVTQPDDPYEQEADRIADQVMAGTAQPVVNDAPQTQHSGGQSVPASVEQALVNPGRPLESGLRQEMEQRFGHDFSQVRVNTSQPAAQSAKEVNARAYTVGHNIIFGVGRFAPQTQAGRHLIAHELVHVVQQRQSGLRLARSPDDKESAKIGSEIEPLELKEWKKVLEAKGYEVYTRKQFDKVDWLAKAFPDKRARPDMVAINPKERKILVGDITAGPWSQAALKPGDVKKLPHDIGAETETKHHLEKTMDNARQASKNLPEGLKGFKVTAQDRWWKEGGYSREITVAKGTAAPPHGTPGKPAEEKPDVPKKVAKPAPKDEISDEPARKQREIEKKRPTPAPKKQPAKTELPKKEESDKPGVKKRRATNDEPTHSGGSRASKVALSVASHGLNVLLQQAQKNLMEVASVSPEAKDLVTGINDLNTFNDFKSFIDNPARFTGQKIKSGMIQGVFNHFADSLSKSRGAFEAKFPDIDSLHSRFHLADYQKKYNEALSRLRLPDARKTFLYAMVALSIKDNTPADVVQARFEEADKVLARMPGISEYVKAFNQARKDYAVDVILLTIEIQNLNDEISGQSDNFSRELRRRGEALARAQASLDDVANRLLNSPFILFAPGEELWLELNTLSEGFANLSSQLYAFADEVDSRKQEYKQELKRLETWSNQIARPVYQLIRP